MGSSFSGATSIGIGLMIFATTVLSWSLSEKKIKRTQDVETAWTRNPVAKTSGQ